MFNKKILVMTLGLFMLGCGAIGMAAPKNTNPYGLVYKDALTKNEAGKVNIHPVNYDLHGIKIAGNVYTPANFDAKKKYPAIVVAHPNGGVKEQVAGLFAQRLAELGYVTLAADASFQGASGGTPRHQDIPYYRTEDIHGMADYLSSYAGVDAERLGVLGICGGGGYTIEAAKSDKRFKAVATLSMFNSGRVRRNGYMDSQLESVEERLHKASEAREIALKTGKHPITGTVDFDSLTDEALAKITTDLYKEGMLYYGRTHRHPNSTFSYTQDSLMELMAWDAENQAELIDAPLLMMAGSEADSLYLTEALFKKAVGSKDKELFLIPGATHIKTYYEPEYVDLEVNKLKDFYGKHL